MISKHCADSLHGYCRGDRSTCDCPSCHLGPCAECGATNLATLYDGLCASCVREHAAEDRATRRHVAHCERCGAAGAFRNPATRRNELLCTSCHLDNGEELALAGGTAGLLAACAGAESDDPRHVWVHLRGTRFVCQGCRTKRYDAAMRAAMRREMLNG